LHAQRMGGDVYLSQLLEVRASAWAPQDGYPRHPRQCLLKNLQPFLAEVYGNGAYPCDIPAGARQVGGESLCNGITASHDDGDGIGGLLRCPSGSATVCKDHFNLKTDQLCGEIGEPLELLCPTILDDEVLSLDVAEVTQLLAKGLGERTGASPRRDVADPVDLGRRLRYRGSQRRAEEAEGEQDDAGGTAPHGDLLPPTWDT